MHAKKTAFVVEHDFIMATYLADRVIVYTGEPSVQATAHSYVFSLLSLAEWIGCLLMNAPTFNNRPQDLLSGMNSFLRSLDVTFPRDPTNYRPRINKHASQLDQEQKSSGNYFFLDE